MINIKALVKTIYVYIILQIIMFIFYFFNFTPPWLFTIFIIVLFIISKPKWLFSPRNMVFTYYFLWYGMAPQFASMFSKYTFTTKEENLAYLMLFATYGISIVLLTLAELAFSKEKLELDSDDNKDKISKYIIKSVNFLRKISEKKQKSDSDELKDNTKTIKNMALISFLLTIVFLVIFIAKTGGIYNWIYDSKMAFIQRRGAGIQYLLFTHSLMIYCISVGLIIYKKKSLKLFLANFLIILVLFPFIGSKAKAILMIFIIISFFVINQKVLSKWIFGSVIFSFLFFAIGIFQRNMTWMKAKDFIPYSLNYFNTLEMFLISIRDFKPNFLKTFLLPLNKVLLLFGKYIHVPFSDMSVWLTSIYYPDFHSVGATQQWPIEADMYLSFYYVLGIPVLAIYLIWLGYAFNKARQGYVSWLLIYTMEFVFILSHYRGGLVLWWYIYLIPFYILVLIIFKNIRAFDSR